MFKVNQKVWCLIYGQGVVTEIQHEDTTYPVVVVFNCSDGRACVYTTDGKYHKEGNIVLFPYPVEIIKSVTKPSIDWSHVSPEYNYLAQDADGRGYLCGKNPHRMNTEWSMETPYIRATTFTSYEPGTCGWEDSLVKRPD